MQRQDALSRGGSPSLNTKYVMSHTCHTQVAGVIPQHTLYTCVWNVMTHQRSGVAWSWHSGCVGEWGAQTWGFLTIGAQPVLRGYSQQPASAGEQSGGSVGDLVMQGRECQGEEEAKAVQGLVGRRQRFTWSRNRRISFGGQGGLTFEFGDLQDGWETFQCVKKPPLKFPAE